MSAEDLDFVDTVVPQKRKWSELWNDEDSVDYALREPRITETCRFLEVDPQRVAELRENGSPAEIEKMVVQCELAVALLEDWAITQDDTYGRLRVLRGIPGNDSLWDRIPMVQEWLWSTILVNQRPI
jgi:hypothetical protein